MKKFLLCTVGTLAICGPALAQSTNNYVQLPAAYPGAVVLNKITAAQTATSISAGNIEISPQGAGKTITFGDPAYGIGTIGVMTYGASNLTSTFLLSGQYQGQSYYAGLNNTHTFPTTPTNTDSGFDDLTQLAGAPTTTWNRENFLISADTVQHYGNLMNVVDNIGRFAWMPSTAYVVNNKQNNGGNIYNETVASCTSAASGGPTGTGTGIVDGTCSWDYVSHDWSGGRALINIIQSINGEENPVDCTNDSCREMTPLLITSNANTGFGGTAPSSGSSAGLMQTIGVQEWCWGGNTTRPGAVNLSNCNGQEIDVGLFNGTGGGANASSAVRSGLMIHSFGDVQGSDEDYALGITSPATATTGFRNFLQVDGSSLSVLTGWLVQYHPPVSGFLAPRGATYGNPVLSGLLDLTGFEPSVSFLRTNGGTNITADGSLNVKGLTIGQSGSAVDIEAGGYYLSGAAVATGGNGNAATDHVYDPASGSVLSGTVNGTGTYTAFSIVQPGHVTTPPANPLTFQGGTGSYPTVTATWTQELGINIGTNSALTTAIGIGNASSTTTITGTIKAGAATGVSCSGTPTASFAVTNGIVTHC